MHCVNSAKCQFHFEHKTPTNCEFENSHTFTLFVFFFFFQFIDFLFHFNGIRRNSIGIFYFDFNLLSILRHFHGNQIKFAVSQLRSVNKTHKNRSFHESPRSHIHSSRRLAIKFVCENFRHTLIVVSLLLLLFACGDLCGSHLLPFRQRPRAQMRNQNEIKNVLFARTP